VPALQAQSPGSNLSQTKIGRKSRKEEEGGEVED
jgi:hypothetical protein